MDKNIIYIIDRIKKMKNLFLDADVAKAIGISKESLSNYKTKGNIPAKRIQLFCEREGVSLDYILYGTGEPFIESQSVQEAPAPYNNERIIKATLCGSDAQENFSELMGMAGAVLNSGTIYADALSQNIRAFHHGVNNETDPGRKRKTLPGQPPGVVDGGRKKASG